MSPLPPEIKEFIAAAQVCRIATVRASGEPHVIPVCPIFDGESTVYVDLGRKSASSEGVRARSVSVLFDEYHDDWSRLQGVLLRCHAGQAQGDELERAWAMIREKFPQYGSVGWEPRLTLALRVQEWRQWGITAPPHYEPE